MCEKFLNNKTRKTVRNHTKTQQYNIQNFAQ